MKRLIYLAIVFSLFSFQSIWSQQHDCPVWDQTSNGSYILNRLHPNNTQISLLTDLLYTNGDVTINGDKLAVGRGFVLSDGGHKVIALGWDPADGKSNLNGYVADIRLNPSNGDIAFRSDFNYRQSGESVGTVNRMVIKKNGYIGINTDKPVSQLDVKGKVTMCNFDLRGGCDLAEPFEMSDDPSVSPGDVVVIDPENPGQLKRSKQAYDARVAGIVSGAGGIKTAITLRQEGVLDKGQNVALIGRVYAKATADNGAIKPGDLLTTSQIAAHAMKATDRESSHGAIIGKALTALEDGEGLVLVLVNLQ